jgi:prepilin-type N-terminal cleavage/methylation domain-containing protein
MNHRHRRRGFTLIEMLVVIVVLGILATLAIPRFMNARAQAFEATAISDLRNVAMVQEMHIRQAGSYAADMAFLDFDPSASVEIEITQATASGWAARASHTSLPARSCGIFVGDADPTGGAPATSPGQIACGS